MNIWLKAVIATGLVGAIVVGVSPVILMFLVAGLVASVWSVVHRR